MKSKKSSIKEKTRKELEELIKNKKTILLASIKNIPSSQFQEIVKKLRGKAIVKVPKKSILFRALDYSGNEAVKKLKNHIKESTAILFSDRDAFELAEELTSKKTPVKAKAGQESVKDIEIPEGPTELIPGPAISELGALGIQIKIEKGKISIKEPKIIVKKGEKISAAAADVMNKFNIKPFSIGFVPLAAFDTKEEKLYTNIKIDKEETLKEIKQAFGKALPFAVQIDYISKDTISFLIRKAAVQERAFERFAAAFEENDVASAEVAPSGESLKTENQSEPLGEAKPQPEQTQTPKENTEENK